MKFAIVGCGRIGEKHAVHMSDKGQLIAVCDIVKQKADTLAAAYGATAYYTLEELLFAERMVDLVAICTPNGLHAKQTILTLQAGKHVLCEKPMAITTADCESMINEAEKAGKTLTIVKQNRFNPPVLAVKKLLDEGRLGKLYSIELSCFWNRDPIYYNDSWRGTMNLDGGTLFTQFSHFIDLLCWMIGGLKSVQAKFSNYAHKGIIEFEDTGVAVLEFENGVSGTLNYTVNSY